MENEAPAHKRGNSQSEQAAHQYFLPAVSMDFLHWDKWDIEALCHALAQKVQCFGLKPCRPAHAEGIPNDNEPQEKRQDEQRAKTFDEGNRCRQRDDQR